MGVSKRNKIKAMRKATFTRYINKYGKFPQCSVEKCGTKIFVGDKYFFRSVKHFNNNHLYCQHCAKEKGLIW